MKPKTIISGLALILSVGFLKAQSQQDISRPATENPLPANHLEVPKPAATTAVVNNTAPKANAVAAPRAASTQVRLAPTPQPKPAQVVRPGDQGPNGQHQAATVKPVDSK